LDCGSLSYINCVAAATLRVYVGPLN